MQSFFPSQVQVKIQKPNERIYTQIYFHLSVIKTRKCRDISNDSKGGDMVISSSTEIR